MSDRNTQGWASWGIAALAGAAVIASLAIAGGPVQARKERRDEARMDDLQRLAAHIACLARDSGLTRPPGDLSPTPGCPGPVPLTDSRTGEAYRVEPLDGRKYRLCAGFELPAEMQPRWAPTRDGDCVVQELPRLLQDGPPLTDEPPAAAPD